MSVQEPKFEDYVHRAKNPLNNFVESYFFLEGLSGKLGGRKFEVVNGKNAVLLKEQPQKVAFLDIVKNIIKIFSYFTVVMPLAMAIGKTYLRQKHQYTLVQDSNRVSEWRRGVNLGQFKIDDFEQIPQKAIAQRKEKTGAIVEKALDTVALLKTIKEDPRLIILNESPPNEIEAIFDDGSEEGIHYTKLYSEKYKMTTWHLDMGGQKYEINEFEKGAYHGPKTEGFIIRENLLMGAARYYVHQLDLGEKKGELLHLLDDLEDEFNHNMEQADCLIDPQLMVKPDKKIGEAHYAAVHSKAEKLLAQLTRDVQYAVHEISTKANPQAKKFDMYALQQAEKEYIIAKGRPTILNTYFVEGSEKKFFSMQRPASAINEKGQKIPRKMLPSTVRDREGLANYVITSSGEVIPTKEGGQIVRTLFEGIRRTSYPPIAIKDPIQRKALAAKNCKQNLTDLAASMMDANPQLQTSPDLPLTVPLRSMLLLTPKKHLDFFRNKKLFIAGKWTGESETLQLEESAYAIKMFNQRTFPIMIEGKEVWIKPDISFMNLGANALTLKEGYFGLLAPASSNLSYNAKGFIDFENDVFEFIEGALKQEPKIKELVKEMSAYGNQSSLLEAKKKLEQVKRKHETQIKNLYEKLEKLSNDCVKHAPGSQERKKLEGQIHLTEERIEKLESEIYDQYKRCLGLKAEVFKVKKDEFAQLFQKILANINIAKDQARGPEKKQLLMARDLVLKLNKAITLFHDQAYKDPTTIIDFQALYLDINESMSKFVEFACKSGEDRTGRLNDQLEEGKIFQVLKGRPVLSSEDKQYTELSISPHVHQFSTSQANTEHNSGGRGKKISSDIFLHLPVKSEKKHASLAKSIFSRAKKIKPSTAFSQKVDAVAI